MTGWGRLLDACLRSVGMGRTEGGDRGARGVGCLEPRAHGDREGTDAEGGGGDREDAETSA